MVCYVCVSSLLLLLNLRAIKINAVPAKTVNNAVVLKSNSLLNDNERNNKPKATAPIPMPPRNPRAII
jgi:hypothetical protein